MPKFALRPAPLTKPVVGLIALGAQVSTLCTKLADREALMTVMGDDWLAAFSFQSDVQLPWMPERPIYLYCLAPNLLCQCGYEPDLPMPVLPALVKKLTQQGTTAITQGPKFWDFSAASPIENSNIMALR